MEAFTKYAERATRAESNMAEMEAKFEERFAMLSMTLQQPQGLHTTAITLSYKPPSYADRIFHHATPTIHPTARNYPHPLPTTTSTISAAIQLRQETTQRTGNEDPWGAAPTTIDNVTNHKARTNNHMEVAVEEEESQRTPTTTNNPMEEAEEVQPPTSETTTEEQEAAERTSGTKAAADNVVRQGNHIPTRVN